MPGTWLREIRAPFLVASAIPVIVGSAAGYAACGHFRWAFFLSALTGAMLLHAGANVANDYFDHVSGNDAANHNLTPFSGGSRVIQQGLMTPRAVLAEAAVLWLAGVSIGGALATLLGSVFLWVLTAVGFAGGLLYTAPPVRLGYRGFGETAFAVIFGVLPVMGAFYLQTGEVAAWTLIPGGLLGVLVSLILLANEFPDEEADRATGKRTLVVLLGRERAARLYFVLLGGAYILAGIDAWQVVPMRLAGILFVATSPLLVVTLRFAARELPKPTGRFAANALTILLFVAAGLSLAAGFLISGFL
jgi:1,4-dihydroxy-2-naphthoate polyprenyltransferase